MITVQDLAMNFGQQVLFEDVGFQLDADNIYGLVGANGSGKSTLLKIMSGEVTPEKGTVSVPSDCKLGILDQDHFKYEEEEAVNVVIRGNEKLWNALLEKEMLTSQAKLSEAEGVRLGALEGIIADEDGYQAKEKASELLQGLGVMSPNALLRTLSGGYKLRVLLAQVLFGQPDFLLLDEPTNHLDLASISWLEEHLKTQCKTALLISHDRHFLNRVCNRMLDVDYEEVRVYKGNYDEFLRLKALENAQKEKAIAGQEKKKAEMQEFVDRFKAKASKARQAGSKQKQIDKMEEITIKRSSRVSPHFNFVPTRPSGKVAFTVRGVGKSYGENTVLEDLSFTLRRGACLAVIGPNGIGKSTLVKMLAGEMDSDTGEIEPGHEIKIGYLPQDHKDMMPDGTTAYEWLYSFDTSQTIGRIRGLLGQVLLQGDDVHKRTESLSGGEAARAILASVMMKNPNVLLIDEPTNHMDIETIEALAGAIKKFEGTTLLVSHDRAFIEEVATSVLELTPDGHTLFEGTYHDYLEKEGKDYLDRSSKSKEVNQATEAAPKKNVTLLTGPEAYKAQKELKNVRKKVQNLEKQIQKAEEEKGQIETDLNKAYSGGSPEEQKTLSAKKAELDKRVADLNQDWEKSSQKQVSLAEKLGEA